MPDPNLYIVGGGGWLGQGWSRYRVIRKEFDQDYVLLKTFDGMNAISEAISFIQDYKSGLLKPLESWL